MSNTADTAALPADRAQGADRPPAADKAASWPAGRTSGRTMANYLTSSPTGQAVTITSGGRNRPVRP